MRLNKTQRANTDITLKRLYRICETSTNKGEQSNLANSSQKLDVQSLLITYLVPHVKLDTVLCLSIRLPQDSRHKKLNLQVKPHKRYYRFTHT